MKTWFTRLLAFVLPFLMVAELVAQEKPADVRPAASAASSERDTDLSREDLELLRELNVLLEWDLLRDWDPAEDLPIPFDLPDPEGGEESP